MATRWCLGRNTDNIIWCCFWPLPQEIFRCERTPTTLLWSILRRTGIRQPVCDCLWFSFSYSGQGIQLRLRVAYSFVVVFCTYTRQSCIIIKGCHEFLAGDALRSKARYSALDETAVFGSICRHQFPQRFFSMKHGERYWPLTVLVYHFTLCFCV